MSRQRPQPPLPPCYAMVHPGLEEVAADEIERDLGGEIRKKTRGIVVFRVNAIDDRLLTLRTTEDVFLFAWGGDLSYRAEDLDRIRRWTAREPDWPLLLRLHHAARPKPKGKPSYRLVVQMNGHHGYFRRDARKALARGLEGKLPASWPHVEDNAAIEIWLTIDEATAVCGVRLSDRTMRHRGYKLEHRPASLRPTLAAAAVRLAQIRPRHVVLDPMCGTGTLLAEHLSAIAAERCDKPPALGGDRDLDAVRATSTNLRRLGAVELCCWDARRLPLDDESIDRAVCNPPFGKQLETPATVGPLYRDFLREMARVLRTGGQAVFLVSALDVLRVAARDLSLRLVRTVKVRILGQPAFLTIWRKGNG